MMLLLLTPMGAHAFHAGDVFDKPSGAGGGGGVFYTGAPREKRWTCAACHEKAPGKIKLDFTAEPNLFADRRYTPGQAYALTAQLAGETLGLSSPQANYNGLAIAVVDSKGDPAGRFSGYAPEDFYDGTVALVSAGKKVGITSWNMTWTAPPPGTGRVTIFICVVDGDGANSPPGVTLNDPFNDDLVCGSIALNE